MRGVFIFARMNRNCMNQESLKKTWRTIFALSCAFIVPEAMPAFAQSTSSMIDEKPGIELAQAKKRKKQKKRRKKKSVDSGDSMTKSESTPAPSIHGEQETIGPYKWHVSLINDFKIVNQQTGDAKSGSGNYDLDAMGLYVMGENPSFAGPTTNSLPSCNVSLVVIKSLTVNCGVSAPIRATLVNRCKRLL